MATASKGGGKSRAKSVTSVKVTVRFSKEDVTLGRDGPYLSVHMDGGLPLAEAGQPALPWRRVFVAVPWGATIKKLTVKTGKAVVLARKAVVEPCQPDVPTVLGSVAPEALPDSRLYRSGKKWPAKVARTDGVRVVGGFAMATVEVCPFQYTGRDKKLELLERIDLTLEYRTPRKKREVVSSLSAARYERKAIARVQELVLNPEHVPLFGDFDDIGLPTDLSSYPEVDYVIVTRDALAETFERLARWRTLLGLRTRVVTVEDILAGTVPDTGGATFLFATGYHDGGTRDEAEAIRNFNKWAHTHWLVDYVLLGGDTEVVPCRQALHTSAGSVYYGDMDTANVDKNYELGFSPEASTALAGSPASNVQDADAATVWECEADDADPWLQLRVGNHKPVNRVDLSWGADHATSYAVEISHDEVNWTQVYSEAAGAGGDEEISFSCESAKYVRLVINSGADFSLATFKVYGPHKAKYGGKAYDMTNTHTRIYLSKGMTPNPTLDDELLIIKSGPHAGTIIPYDPACSDTSLGWRFVEDLPDMPGVVSAGATSFVEILGPAAYHGNPLVLKSQTNYIPADLYYSDVLAVEYPDSDKHDWDENGNGIYGERFGGELDGVNGIADVQLGRAPVETIAAADSFIDKVIRYERYLDQDEFGIDFLLPMDFATNVLLGAQDWSKKNTVGVMDGTVKGKENIRRDFLTHDPDRWTFTRRYEDHADVPAADQGPDLAVASKAEILDAILDGNNVVSLSSHGSSGYLCYLVSGDIDGIESPPAIFYGNACSTNKFDISGGEAFSEKTILNPNGSAVAYVGNTRFGWTSDNPVEYAFWMEMLTADRLGDMFAAAKLAKFGWQAYSYNLLGDPGMRVWSDSPSQIEVGHPDEICTGPQDFPVEVSSDGSPVAGALVCVTMEGSLFKTGVSDAAGVATLAISPSLVGEMRVTVSGKNLLPYLGTTNVVACPNICPTVIVCGPAVICRSKILCKVSVGCSALIACKPSIACKANIDCSKIINCKALISCGKLINCGQAIMCKGLIGCDKAVICKADIFPPCKSKIACAGAIDMCPTIRPEEFDIFDLIKDVWDRGDLKDIVEDLEDPEFKLVLERLPEEVRKPVLMMLKRIAREGRR